MFTKKYIIINDTINLSGICSISITSKDVQDSKSVDGLRQEIRIIGNLEIESYISIIDKIETNNFIIDGIFVSVEKLNSNTHKINYVFTAENIQFKKNVRIIK